MGNCQPGQEQPNAGAGPTIKRQHSATTEKVRNAARSSAMRRASSGEAPPIPRSKVFRSASGGTYDYDPSLDFIKNRNYYSVQMTSKHTFTVDIRYQKLKRIGSGAYGIVCSAVDQVTGMKVAIKKVGDVFADLVDAKRILREIRILTHLSPHKNIVGLLDVMVGPKPVADFKDLYLVFELFDGDLDRVDQVIKVTGFVNGVPEFMGHGKVVDGCSNMLVDVLGDRGKHARSCVGTGSLPAAVSMEMSVRIKD